MVTVFVLGNSESRLKQAFRFVRIMDSGVLIDVGAGRYRAKSGSYEIMIVCHFERSTFRE